MPQKKPVRAAKPRTTSSSTPVAAAKASVQKVVSVFGGSATPGNKTRRTVTKKKK